MCNTKKWMLLILSFVIIIGTITPVKVFASEEENSVKNIAEIVDNDLFISDDVAVHIAALFVQDICETGLTAWDTDTSIIDTVTMYDETGNNVTAYTFELTKGYVVVSAYLDVPNIILEWSDEVLPIYKESMNPSSPQAFSTSQNTKITYLGTLDYYFDDGGESLRTSENDTVFREEISGGFSDLRDITNVAGDTLSYIMANKHSASILASDNTSGGYITDPYEHAKNVYGGTWVCQSYANEWDKYANYAVMDDFSGYKKHCGPVAITNIIKMYGNKYNKALIKNSSNQMVFNKVMEANDDNLLNGQLPYYLNGGGTENARANEFIQDAFGKFLISVSVSGRNTASFNNIKGTFGTNPNAEQHKLIYLMVQGHSPYGDHHVAGYAYTRLYSSSKKAYKSYLKVCDGHQRGGRYIDMGSITSDKYWTVYFTNR